MQEVIPLIGLLKEISVIFGVVQHIPEMKCTLFEDNNSCLLLSRAPIMNPRTKYIALKYHHFRSYVSSKQVSIMPIDTIEQMADIFTKPLPDGQF